MIGTGAAFLNEKILFWFMLFCSVMFNDALVAELSELHLQRQVYSVVCPPRKWMNLNLGPHESPATSLKTPCSCAITAIIPFYIVWIDECWTQKCHRASAHQGPLTLGAGRGDGVGARGHIHLQGPNLYWKLKNMLSGANKGKFSFSGCISASLVPRCAATASGPRHELQWICRTSTFFDGASSSRENTIFISRSKLRICS